jgi:hypothetical protein
LKKLIATIAMVGTLGIGGILTYSMIGEEPESKTESEVSATSEETKEEATVVVAPTERTVDTNGDVPWNYMTADQIKSAQDSGEVVYLFSDAEAVETYTVELAKNPDTTPYDKDTLATSWSSQLEAFLEGVKDSYPDQLDYFMKIEEVKVAMAAFNYDQVVLLIEEAKALR